MLADFSPSHLDAAASLSVSVFNAPPWNDQWTPPTARQRLHDLLSTPGSAGMVLLEQDRPVAFALGHTEQWFVGRHFFLKEMCVLTSLRRSGHGTRLLQTLEQRLAGVEQVYLLTARGGPAHNFYESRGYRPAQRQGLMTKPLGMTTPAG